MHRNFTRLNDKFGNLFAFICKGIDPSITANLLDTLKLCFGSMESTVHRDTKAARESGDSNAFKCLHFMYQARYCTQVCSHILYVASAVILILPLREMIR